MDTPYTVHQLANLAGVSVRTLHHYDQIGLLKPGKRNQAGYRLYGEEELLRLQQILFYRELDFPLEEIQRILDRPGFDPLEALRSHRHFLKQEKERLERLIHTVDRTINKLTEENMELTDAELYEGFTQEEIEEYKKETLERYDPKIVAESYQRVRKMSKAQWQQVRQEGDAVTRGMASLMERQPGDPAVQALMARHYAWIGNFYTVTDEIYRGLGDLYTSDPRFRANYEKYRPGLADFMQAAMVYFVEHK